MHFGPLRGALLLMAVGMVAATPFSAAAQVLSTYDDFNSGRLDGRRWHGVEEAIEYANLVGISGGWSNQPEGQWTRDPDFSTVNTAVQRRIVGEQLQLRLNTAGGSHPDPDVSPGHGRVALRMRNVAQPVTILQSQVTMIEAETQPCRTTGQSRGRAQLFTRLFNDGSGDLFATLSLQRRSFDTDRIVAVVSKCRDQGCTIADDLGSVVFTRRWTLGLAQTLTITHQAGSNRVAFSVIGGGLTAETRYVSYPPPPSRAESARHYELRLETTPANCPAAGGTPSQRVEVTLDARFDNVRVNAAAAPAP